MDDRSNTVAGWVLFAGIIAMGAGIVSAEVFHTGRPEKMGYPIEGVEVEGGEGGSGPSIATLLATADPAKGEAVFKKCVACHTVNQGGANGIGPNLYATVGKPHGHMAGFAYSDALKSVPGNWTFDALNEWLTSPRKYAPGTKMTFAGLGNPEDRANVIAYLNAQGSNLPLPAADAAPAADKTAAAGEAGENAAVPDEGKAAPAEGKAAPAAH
ncbi:c-type cytochrome [Rhizorhapis suberifaciens]|uniref:Cytochrome c n=1 Tax=Rhizorhapis suberifaciens TaxID=13656 RepID=A0A840HQN3_9SPHN|nr:cytochrome c family protein [Rhizorhapis suberifaciens]MBB4640245.1 cytochrome c [Rhizorhapis suberifaciens]